MQGKGEMLVLRLGKDAILGKLIKPNHIFEETTGL